MHGRVLLSIFQYLGLGDELHKLQQSQDSKWEEVGYSIFIQLGSSFPDPPDIHLHAYTLGVGNQSAKETEYKPLKRWYSAITAISPFSIKLVAVAAEPS